MPVGEKLLNEHYRFREDFIPSHLTSSQRDARRHYLEEIHRKGRYSVITQCPYCGHGNFTKISEIDARALPSSIVVCDLCGGCFKNEIMSSDGNRYHYEHISYLLRGKSISTDAIESTFAERVKKFAYPRYHFISHFIDLDPRDDVIAEFGCNDGANLFPWHEKRFTTIGVELDSKMVEFGKKIGIDIVCGDFSSFSLARKPKLIILSHVLEHVSDINAVVARLGEILAPDGFLFIEVPGLRVQAVGDALRYFDVEHNYNFDFSSLKILLERCGFKLIYGDEYARLLCTPSRNNFTVTRGRMPVSAHKIKAAFLKKCIESLSGNSRKIYDVLKESAHRSLKTRLLGKMYMLYFGCYYSSFTEV